MFDGIPYGLYLDTSSCRVSVDNLRLKFVYKYKSYDFEGHEIKLTVDRISESLTRLFYDGLNVVASNDHSFKIGNYLRAFTIKGGIWSCVVLVGRFTFEESNKGIAPEAVFDFNPNKIPRDIITRVISVLSCAALEIQIKRYDVAFDFPVSRYDVNMLPVPGRTYNLLDHSQKGRTEYIGDRSSHGAIKLYDKTKESKLTCDVTRCEITVDGDYKKSLATLYPEIFSLVSVQVDMDFNTLPFAVKACILHPDLLDVMAQTVDHKTKKKYLGMIRKYNKHPMIPDNWTEIDRFIHSALTSYVGSLQSGGVLYDFR